MITKRKLNIYRYFKGDIDGLVRGGTAEQKALMRHEDWIIIDSLIQDIEMVKKGLAGEKYINVINESLLKCCDNEETIYGIKELAEWNLSQPGKNSLRTTIHEGEPPAKNNEL